MHGTAILQVTNQCNGLIVESALRLAYRIEVQQGLRGMLVSTISRIDDGGTPELRGIECSSFKVVTHHDGISIVTDHRDGILEGFALSRAGSRRIREANDTTSKAIYSGLKA